ncbi:Phi-29-like late activator, partial [Enterococcus faecalis]|nr:Phi-29-like late activator [Enterococcus faecalis]
MGRECIKQNTKVAITITGKMKQTRNDIQKTKEKIIQLDKQGELIIPYLKTVFEK